MHDGIHDGIRTKVLAELMHHMINMHGAGKSKNPEMHSSDATLPHPDGTPKHEPAGKIEGVSVISAKPIHESEIEPVSMNEHGGEGDHVMDHELGDLFGRKHKGHSEYF